MNTGPEDTYKGRRDLGTWRPDSQTRDEEGSCGDELPTCLLPDTGSLTERGLLSEQAWDEDGYAHVAFVVDDLEGTLEGFKEQRVNVTLEPKTLTADGNDYRIAFIEAPDGYKIEPVQQGIMKVGNMVR